MAGTVASAGRVARHARVLGVLWMVYSVLHLIGGVVLLIVASTIFGPMGPEHEAPPFVRPLLSFLGVLLLATGVVGIGAGYGIMQRLPWSRVVLIILGIIAIPASVPFGTVLGIYTLWVLFSADADREFRAPAF